jgi:hypothetical protein
MSNAGCQLILREKEAILYNCTWKPIKLLFFIFYYVFQEFLSVQTKFFSKICYSIC